MSVITASPDSEARDRPLPRERPSGHGGPGRRLAPFSLQDWRVRSKLIAVLVIPTVAFLVLAGLNVAASARSAQAFSRGEQLARLARDVTAITHELQLERDLTAGLMSNAWRGDAGELTARQDSVNQLVEAYRSAEAPLHDRLGPALGGRFDAVRAGLRQLPDLREAASSSALTQEAVFGEYTQLIAALLDVNQGLAQQAGTNEEFAQRVRVFSDISQVKEIASQVRGRLYAIGFQRRFAFGEFQDFADLLAQRQAAFQQFQEDADSRQQALLGDVVQGQAVLAVVRIQDGVINRQSSGDLGIDAQQWLAASTTEIQLMRTVETRLLDGVVAQAQDLAAAARREAVVNGLVVAVIVAVALIASLVVARSMVRPLRRLRSAALGVAQTQLPAAIEQLRTTNTGELDIRVEPVGVRSRDEIGEVAGAFDTVHQEAVRLATEQAALRKSINDMFVNLARRNQTLIDRQLNMIEDLERDTDDPDEMAELFRLDHLATRMRRNQENLLVLASAEPGKRWSDPVALAHLLQEAMGEVEDFTRVELLTNDDAMVVGYATSDIVHLLAELIENATMFSPPHTPVRIATQAAANGYLIEIEDQGTGMSDEDLDAANERLVNPPEIDFALSRRLGFFVVGRLARRHGIRVQLRHSWYGGVTALVLVPGSLFMPGTIATPVGVAGNRRGMPELSPAGVLTGDFGGNGRSPWMGDTAPAAPWAGVGRRGSGLAAGDSADQAAPAAPTSPLPAGGPPAARDRGRTSTEPPPSPGRPAFTPRVSDAARLGSRARARASAGDRPHDPAEPGGRAGEEPRHRLGGRRGDPLASYQTGLVQGRVTGDLERPPPLSSPSSQFRNDDQPPPR